MNERLSEDRPLIPAVSHETLESAIATMREVGRQYYINAGEKLLTEQPNLSEHLGLFIRSSAETVGEHDKMFELVLFIYDVLSRQAEAEAMNRGLGPPA